MQQDDQSLRHSAAKTLGTLGIAPPTEMIERHLESLGKRTGDMWDASCKLRDLGFLLSAEVIEQILNILASNEAERLPLLPEREMNPLLDALERADHVWTHACAANALSALGSSLPERGIALLLDVIEQAKERTGSEHWHLCGLAADALIASATLLSPLIIERLLKILEQTENEYSRHAAVRVIGNAGFALPERGIYLLLDAIEQRKDSLLRSVSWKALEKVSSSLSEWAAKRLAAQIANDSSIIPILAKANWRVFRADDLLTALPVNAVEGAEAIARAGLAQGRRPSLQQPPATAEHAPSKQGQTKSKPTA